MLLGLLLARGLLICLIVDPESIFTRADVDQPVLASEMNWFQEVFGFPEEGGYEKVRSLFRVYEDDRGATILATVPPDGCGRSLTFHVGKFDTPSVAELRTTVAANAAAPGDAAIGITFQHMVGDVGDLHLDPSNAGAVFQAASQFNCLEMVGPNIKPEGGVTRYAMDHTQGPACALSCPAGTVYRNYFVNGRGQGGSEGKQLDMLGDFGQVVGNNNSSASRGANHWRTKNGYVLPLGKTSIRDLSKKLKDNKPLGHEAMESLRVGVHWDTEVVRCAREDGSASNLHRVAQVYVSALPIGYDYTTSASDWEPFARLVLDGLYEASLAVASILAQKKKERVKVFLTMVGGGVFNNEPRWISSAIERALGKFREQPLDIYLVHYGRLDPHYVRVIGAVGKGEAIIEATCIHVADAKAVVGEALAMDRST